MTTLKPLTEVSVSSINAFQADPARWVLGWVCNRVPRHQPVALTVGKAVHRAFEIFFKGESPTVGDALRTVIDTTTWDHTDPHTLNVIDLLTGLVEPLTLWKEAFPIQETLAVEEAFTFPLSNGLIFRGRPDRVVRCYDQLWHFQTKTLAGGIDPTVFTLGARRNLHEALYGAHLKDMYPDEAYAGTIYNIIRKLKYRRKPMTKTEKANGKGRIVNPPTRMFVQLPIPPVRYTDAIHDLERLSTAMRQTAQEYIDHGVLPPSNRRLDTGPFGNSIDPYTPVFLGETSLHDDAVFMDREDTYQEEREDQ